MKRNNKNSKGRNENQSSEFAPEKSDEVTLSKTATLDDCLDIFYSSITTSRVNESYEDDEKSSLIVDGGAAGTVVGLKIFIRLCGEIGVKPMFISLQNATLCRIHSEHPKITQNLRR